MDKQKFNLFNWQPFYVLVVLMIFSAYIHRNEQNHQLYGHYRIINASLTNDIENQGDQNAEHGAALHSQFSHKDPFDSFPGKESIKDIRLNIFEVINFNQTDKNVIKTLFCSFGIHISKMCWFIFPPSFHSFSGIATFLVLRV